MNDRIVLGEVSGILGGNGWESPLPPPSGMYTFHQGWQKTKLLSPVYKPSAPTCVDILSQLRKSTDYHEKTNIKFPHSAAWSSKTEIKFK
jgi:hypothetical protein